MKAKNFITKSNEKSSLAVNIKLDGLATKEDSMDSTAANTQIGAVTSSDKHGEYEGYAQNPDLLIQKKGLSVYDYMMTDDQVFISSAIKKIARLSTDFDVYPNGKDAQDKEISDFVRHSLFENMDITIRELIFNLMTALDYGYSIAEKVWKYEETGPYKGKVVFKSIAPKDPKGFLFDREETGELKKNGIVQNTGCLVFGNWSKDRDKMKMMPHYPTDKFVVFSYNSKFRNPYGISDFRSGYRAWISKDIISKIWNMYLENYGSPIAMCEVPAGADSDDITKMQKVLSSLQHRSSFTYPEGFKPGFMESMRPATPGFEKKIGIENGALVRSSALPELLGFSGGFGTGGSYGLGKTQYDMFIMLLDFIGLIIEETIFEKQIIKPLVDMNYPDVKRYPIFKFSSMKRETRKDRAQILQILTSSRIITHRAPWMLGFVDLPIQQEEFHGSGEEIILPGKGQQDPIGSTDGLPDERGATRSDGDEQSITDDSNPNVKD